MARFRLRKTRAVYGAETDCAAAGFGLSLNRMTAARGVMSEQPTRYIVTDGQMTLTLDVAEEGGYLVTSPFNPEVLTQADSLEEAFEMVRDAAKTMRESRAELRKRAAGSKRK